jgi:4-diphosphocytidyl-2-C-methyl-D-erythritol kinase
VAPVVTATLDALAALPGARLARMSGSGATCFALFDDPAAADTAGRILEAARPDWWVRAAPLA